MVSVRMLAGRGNSRPRSAAATEAADRAVPPAVVVGASVVDVDVESAIGSPAPAPAPWCVLPLALPASGRAPAKPKSSCAEVANSRAATRTRRGPICRPKLSTAHAANSVMSRSVPAEPPSPGEMVDVETSNTKSTSAMG